MKRFILIVILLVLVIGGGWFLISSHTATPAASTNLSLLLIDKQAKTYSFTTYPGQTYDPAFQAVGPMNQYSDQQITDMTAGLQFVALGNSAPQGAVTQIPTPDQQGPWLSAIRTLTAQQQQLCAGLSQSDSSQYCMIRHLVLNAIVNKKSSSACDAIFIDAYKQECVKNLTAMNLNSVPDANHNGLIDLFESAQLIPNAR